MLRKFLEGVRKTGPLTIRVASEDYYNKITGAVTLTKQAPKAPETIVVPITIYPISTTQIPHIEYTEQDKVAETSKPLDSGASHDVVMPTLGGLSDFSSSDS